MTAALAFDGAGTSITRTSRPISRVRGEETRRPAMWYAYRNFQEDGGNNLSSQE
jgi:hypothetical protein